MKRNSFLVALLIVAVTSLKAEAQINPDHTLGPDRSRLTPASDRTVIEGGARRGRNLFHSFREFNVETGRSVYFANPDGVQRIFGRVTGSNRSNILGTLGVLGNADLFLINPNGILFGPNARLDVRGSFLATTADRVLFHNYSFNASNPTPPPLLTIHRPIGLQMGATPGAIRMEGNATTKTQFSVPNSETFGLLGGNVTLTNAEITAPSGRINLGSLRSGTVKLTETGTGFRLESPVLPIDPTFEGDNVLLDNARLFIAEQGDVVGSASDRGIYFLGNNIQLHNQSDVEINNNSSSHGGPIRVDANRLRLSLGGKLETTSSLQGIGGEIIINAADQVTLIGNNPVDPLRISNILTASDTVGRGGDIRIQTGRLQLRQGAEIISFGNRAGRGGDVTIRASESITATGIPTTRPQGGSNIGAVVWGSGRGGNIHIVTPRLVLRDGNRVQAVSNSSGHGGNITIEANTIIAEGFNPKLPFFPSGIVALPLNSGDGGDIRVITQNLDLSRGANLSTALASNYEVLTLLTGGEFDAVNAGTGNAGNLRVQANRILIRGGNPRLPDNPTQLSSVTFGQGDAGDVDVSTRELTILDGGALLSASLLSLSVLGTPLPTSGRGNGGNLTVNAENILLDGLNRQLGLSSLLGTLAGGFGQGGNTQIRTGNLTVRNGGTVNSGTYAVGNAGRLAIEADSIQVEGVHASGQRSAIGTFADRPDPTLREAFVLPARPTGDTGELTIQSDYLNVEDGGLISVRHQGSGNAGRMRLRVNQLQLNGGELSAETALGQGGNITVQSDTLLLRQNSQITATALGGTGNGGNLTLNSELIGTLPNENNDLIANSVGGNGGEINLTTPLLAGFEPRDRLTSESDITASSELGIDGTIRILSPNIDTNQLTTELPEAPLDSSDQITTGCPADQEASFVVSGRGGLPATPSDILNRTVWQDDRVDSTPPESYSSLSNRSDAAANSGGPIVEAQTWVLNDRGQVELRPTLSAMRPSNRNSALCFANQTGMQ